MTSGNQPASLPASGPVLVSYVGPDLMWAEWINEQLERVGVVVDILEWSSGPDAGLPATLRSAAKHYAQCIAVMSSSYIDAVVPTAEVGEATTTWATGHPGVLVPVLVRRCKLPPRFWQLSPVDLREVTDDRTAVRRLLSRVPGGRDRAGPGEGTEAMTLFPGRQPPVWSPAVPPRNPYFTGRNDMLRDLRRRVTTDVTALLPHSLQGLGGVGKTQLAAEYAYRFAADYDIVWWVNAETQAAAREGLANLAVRLDIGGPAAETSELIRAALDALRTGHPHRRWLLVFDNAGAPADIQPLLPSGQGHVLITSRDQTWENQADVMDVDVYARAESRDFLRRRVRGLTAEAASRLAEELGDLPLALEHAAGFLAAGQMTADGYLTELRKQARELLDTRPPANYPVSVAVTWTISANKLRDQDENAARLLDMCAFIGPEPIPLSLLANAPHGTLPEGLGLALESAGQRAAILESIRAYSLARIGGREAGPFPGTSLQQHRLVQAVVRDTVSAVERAGYRAAAHRILAAADPGDPELPANWPVYAELLPHVFSSGAVANTDPLVRRLVLHEARALWRRAEFQTCLDLLEDGTATWSRELDEVDPDMLSARHERSNALQGLGRFSDARRANQEWYDLTTRRLGPDHDETLRAAGWVAKDHRTLGNFAPALELNQHILDVETREHGRDAGETLRAAHNLAVNYRMIGDFATALEIDRYNAEVLARVQGPGSFSALFAVNNVARDLRELGRYYESLEMQESTFSRYRELFGIDSPETLRAMKNLAVTRRKAGRYAEAAELAEEVLERHRRKMGDLHPETLAATTNFANDHRCLGQYATGQGLAELALRGYQRLFGDDNAFTACLAVNLAALLRLTGDPERARAVNEDALPKLRRSFGPGHRYTLSCSVNLASDLAELGEPENARDLGTAALTALHESCGEDHPYTLGCSVNLALDLRTLGERDSYRDLLADTVARYNRTLGSGHPESASAAARERAVCDIEPPPV